jgi:hypothetical protein
MNQAGRTEHLKSAVLPCLARWLYYTAIFQQPEFRERGIGAKFRAISLCDGVNSDLLVEPVGITRCFLYGRDILIDEVN